MMDEAASGAAERRQGALGQADGSIRWRVWAPKADRVELVLIDGDRWRDVPMEREEHGYYHCTLPDIPEGQRYAYRLSNGPERVTTCAISSRFCLHAFPRLINSWRCLADCTFRNFLTP